MRWTPAELEGRQSALFDVMLGECVAPLERQAPSEKDLGPAAGSEVNGGPVFGRSPHEERETLGAGQKG
jgi:hypothetical protein